MEIQVVEGVEAVALLVEGAGHLEEAEAMVAEEAVEPTNKTALLKKFL